MNDDTINRLKKLLRLSRDKAATPAEAALALAKARQIAETAGIDLTAIPQDESGTFGMNHVTEPSQAGILHRLGARIVREYFGVQTLFDSREVHRGGKRVIHFIGSEVNCELARYVYIYLVRLMRDAWRLRENRRLRDRESFLRGFAIAIEGQIPPTFNLSGLIPSADAYIEGVIMRGNGVLVTPKKKGKIKLSDSAFRNGFIAGTDASIHNAIKTSPAPLLPNY